MKGKPDKGQSFHSLGRGRALDMGEVVVDYIISWLRQFVVDRLKSYRSR